MRDAFLVLTLILTPLVSFSQVDSVYKDSIFTESRLLFSQSEEIQLVQLEPYCSIQKRPVGIFGRLKKINLCYESSVIHCNSDSTGYSCEIDTSHIGTSRPLVKEKYDSLFNLLYSTQQIDWRAACYNPRHGIAFYSSEGEMLGFLEICFECYAIHSLPNTPFLGTPNEEALLKLKSMFRDAELFVN